MNDKPEYTLEDFEALKDSFIRLYQEFTRRTNPIMTLKMAAKSGMPEAIKRCEEYGWDYSDAPCDISVTVKDGIVVGFSVS